MKEELQFEKAFLLEGHTGNVSCAKFNPKAGQLLASCSDDKTLKLWDLSKMQCTKTLHGHAYGVNDLSFSVDGSLLSSASNDTFLCIWDLHTGDLLRTCEGHSDFATSSAFNRNSTIIVSGSYDNSIMVWDLRIAKAIFKIVAHSDPITDIDISYDDTLILSSSLDGFLRTWDLLKGTCLKTSIITNNSPISSGKFAKNSRYALVGGMNNLLGLYDIIDGNIKKSFQGHTNENYILKNTMPKIKSNFYVMSPSECNSVFIWSVKTGEIIDKLPCCSFWEEAPGRLKDAGEEEFLTNVDYSGLSQYLVACGPNSHHALYVWHLL